VANVTGLVGPWFVTILQFGLSLVLEEGDGVGIVFELPPASATALSELIELGEVTSVGGVAIHSYQIDGQTAVFPSRSTPSACVAGWEQLLKIVPVCAMMALLL